MTMSWINHIINHVINHDMSYSQLFSFHFKSTCMTCCLRRNFNIQESCIRKRWMFAHQVLCLISHAIQMTWILESSPSSYQMVRPINNAIQKSTLEYHIECDNHYNYNNCLFKPFPFCESLLVIKFSAYD